MMKIAITGGLGSGKSTVSAILARSVGAAFLNSDQICRDQMEPGALGYQAFVQQTGKRFCLPGKKIDRARLHTAVFSEPSTKALLEGILHPLVRDAIDGWHGDAWGRRHLVAEVPLLYETCMENQFDLVVVVYCPSFLSAMRVTARDGLDKRAIAAVERAQLPIEQKIDLADYVVDNRGTLAATVLQVHRCARDLLAKASNIDGITA
jgi:dephospho-CoA kinase